MWCCLLSLFYLVEPQRPLTARRIAFIFVFYFEKPTTRKLSSTLQKHFDRKLSIKRAGNPLDSQKRVVFSSSNCYVSVVWGESLWRVWSSVCWCLIEQIFVRQEAAESELTRFRFHRFTTLLFTALIWKMRTTLFLLHAISCTLLVGATLSKTDSKKSHKADAEVSGVCVLYLHSLFHQTSEMFSKC